MTVPRVAPLISWGFLMMRLNYSAVTSPLKGLCLAAFMMGGGLDAEEETLAPLKEGVAPANFEELWSGFDPRKEPMEVEVLKEWEEDGVVMKVLRYRIGVFKGKKSMMAAVYGFPKGGKALPGLVQIHGGGQYANYQAVLTNAKRGYATISISWAGRIEAPDYRVTPNEVKLFWENKTDDRHYKVTTDWGALDAYHAPCRNPKNAFAHVNAAEWTLDAVDSPRNNPWFLAALGARRGLTFLERQPEVDASKLGVYGHSMGGKLTVMTVAADSRVKAAAPSCGGMSDRDNGRPLYETTIDDEVSLKQISCPTIFLSPANDFHGRINDLQTAVTEIQSKEWRVTCAAHHNHQDTPSYEVATQLWFDEHLKGNFKVPETPRTQLELVGKNGNPVFTVRPDASKRIVSVDVYYSQQGQIDGLKDDRLNTIARFWHHAAATDKDGLWISELPLFSTEKPLWVYANVAYALEKPISGAGYYYGSYTAEQFNLSSLMAMVRPEDLQAAGLKASLRPSRTIESFTGDWEKEWFNYRAAEWTLRTHKVYHPQWAAPEGAKLALEVRSAEANKLVVGIDQHAAEVALTGGAEWQEVVLALDDFRDAADGPLSDWKGIMELRLLALDRLRAKVEGENKTRVVGGQWKGAKPEFRSLRWESGK